MSDVYRSHPNLTNSACIRGISIMSIFEATFQATNIHAIPCQDYDILEEKYQKALIHCLNTFTIYPTTPKQNLLQKTCIAAKSKRYSNNILQRTILLFIKVEHLKNIYVIKCKFSQSTWNSLEFPK